MYIRTYIQAYMKQTRKSHVWNKQFLCLIAIVSLRKIIWKKDRPTDRQTYEHDNKKEGFFTLHYLFLEYNYNTSS